MTERERERLQANIFLRTLLPLLEVVVEQRPVWRERFASVNTSVGIGARDSELGVHLVIMGGRVQVVQGVHPAPDLALSFSSLAAMNGFFAGRPSVPRIRGAIAHPIVCGLVLWLISQLRILAPSTRQNTDPGQRALYVQLVLYFITEALVEMNGAGHPAMTGITRGSPERVYQWIVEDSDMGAYVRVHDGQAWAGRGVYPHRRAFVKYTFPTVEHAFRVFTTTGSQMASVSRGDVRPEGSPEYSRKISIAMQKAEQVLTRR